MKRLHALLIAVALAVATVAGTLAALHTTQLGAKATGHVSSAQIARQNRALTRAEAALRAELRHKPPAIAKLPRGGQLVAAPTIVYHRPPPVVHVIHRAWRRARRRRQP